jgi:hypothetical protein
MRLTGLRYWQASSAMSAGAVREGYALWFEQAGVNVRVDAGERETSYRAYCGTYHLGHMPHFASELLRAARVSRSIGGRVRTLNGSGAKLEIDAVIHSPLVHAPPGHTLNCQQIEGGGIYAIVNVRDMRAYVGKTKNFNRRRKQHLSNLQNGVHPQIQLQSDWLLTPDAFAFVVVDESPEDAKKKEAYRIFIYGTQDPSIGYNFGDGFSPGRKRRRATGSGGGTSEPLSSYGGEPALFGAADLPPLPDHRTLASITEYLAALGFRLVDKRTNSGGGLWVFNTREEFGYVAQHLKRNGIGVRRYPKGRRRYAADHYEIDPQRALNG